MTSNIFTMQSEVWLYPGKGGWHFLTLPAPESEAIRAIFADLNQGWGSLPVIASIGQTTWETSIFPDAKTGSYLLPIKAHIRKKENIAAGDQVTFRVEIRL